VDATRPTVPPPRSPRLAADRPGGRTARAPAGAHRPAPAQRGAGRFGRRRQDPAGPEAQQIAEQFRAPPAGSPHPLGGRTRWVPRALLPAADPSRRTPCRPAAALRRGPGDAGRGRPLVLFVDDAQAARTRPRRGYSSAGARRVLVVLTVPPGNRGRRLTELWKDTGSAWNWPGSTRSGRALLTAALGGRWTRPGGELAEHSGGTCCSCANWCSARWPITTRPGHGVWRCAGRWPPPNAIVELVSNRLGDLARHRARCCNCRLRRAVGSREVGEELATATPWNSRAVDSYFRRPRLQVRLASALRRRPTADHLRGAHGRDGPHHGRRRGGNRRAAAVTTPCVSIWRMDGGGATSELLMPRGRSRPLALRLRPGERSRRLRRTRCRVRRPPARPAVGGPAGPPAERWSRWCAGRDGRERHRTRRVGDREHRPLWVFLGRPLDGLRVAAPGGLDHRSGTGADVAAG